MLCCKECFSSPTLRCLISEKGTSGDCECCMAQKVPVVEARTLAGSFGWIDDVYYAADELDETNVDGTCVRVKGKRLSDLVQTDWQLFSDGFRQDMRERFLKVVMPEDDRGKELWGRRREIAAHPSMVEQWQAIGGNLVNSRRFFPDVEIRDRDWPKQLHAQGEFAPLWASTLKWLPPILERLAGHLPAQAYWRARINKDGRREPYPACKMGPPPPDEATGGRANPHGIPYLYLASDITTAISEVRSGMGAYVTVGEFELKGKLKIADFMMPQSFKDPFACAWVKGKVPIELESIELIRHFNTIMSTPMSKSDRELDYLPTQYLSELILIMGFDGIKYESALGTGFNVVIFKPSLAAVKGKPQLHKVRL